MSDIEYAYIAVEPCGCVTAATVDNPRHQRDTARDIAKWVRDGRIVEAPSHPASARASRQANVTRQADHRVGFVTWIVGAAVLIELAYKVVWP